MKKLVLYFLFLCITPFYGQIQSYYNGLDLTKTGNELFLELSTRIIATHSGIPYTSGEFDVWDACRQADEDPDISTNVLLIYGFDDDDGIPDTDRTRNKDLQDTGGGIGVWNREHVFSQSLASPSFSTGEPGPGTDVHNIRPADRARNTERSNRKFTDGSGSSGIVSGNGGWYPGDEWKGDVARIVMYMYLRYHGDGSAVTETRCLPINVGFGTVLGVDSNMTELFLLWNVEDPVSTFEADRNEALADIQENRNPFIDNPYLATLIWGGLEAEDKWWANNSGDTEAPSAPSNLVATNITDESVEISWDASSDNVSVYDYLVYLNGVYLQSTSSTSSTLNNLTQSTNYNITVKARDAASNLSESSTILNVTTLEGPLVLFAEDFSDCGDLEFFTFNEASDKDWQCETQYGENNSGSIGINGYQQDELSKDWLITNNPIDFDINDSELLSFYTDAAYGTTPLELVYSSDYDGFGNPADFIWISVPNITIPIHLDGSGAEEVYIFTDVDISEIVGSVYMAFKYYSDDAPTRWTVDSFEITADLNEDIDSDGVLNVDDLCANTPEGESVDVNGCSYGQLDDDNDGVQNSDDTCSDTPSGESVDTNGCSDSQLDDDNDGVMNNADLCADTPNGETVDTNGCSYGQLDDDNDGVQNSEDTCSDTPSGESVDTNGCSDSQLDDDNDGIMNNVDLCDDTPNGEAVDTNGCSDSQLDDDSDGVNNAIDLCPDTTVGSTIDANGCFTLSSDNFGIEVISETCPEKDNGQIVITVNEFHSYETRINETDYNFTTSLSVGDLAPGTYEFCITVTGENYEQCYTVEVVEGTIISGKASVTKNKVAIEIIKGTAPYKVFINEKLVLQTLSSTFNAEVNHGDIVEVKTAVSCEGIFSKTIELFDTIVAYPNPTQGNFEIALPILQKEVIIELYSMQSQLISVNAYPVVYGKIQLNLESKPTGLYFIKILLNKPIVLKIVKE